MITPEILQRIVPSLDDDKAAEVAGALNPAMEWAEINTPDRMAAFIAQCAHEADGFNTLEEYASGDAYEGREDLGNTEDGDGRRFKGRGPIQLTGRGNYIAAGIDLGFDLVNNPEMVATWQVGFMTSAWYWNSRNLNRYADSGDFRTLTRRIDGGLNGLADRMRYWERAKEALGVA